MFNSLPFVSIFFALLSSCFSDLSSLRSSWGSLNLEEEETSFFTSFVFMSYWAFKKLVSQLIQGLGTIRKNSKQTKTQEFLLFTCFLLFHQILNDDLIEPDDPQSWGLAIINHKFDEIQAFGEISWERWFSLFCLLVPIDLGWNEDKIEAIVIVSR